MNYKVSYQCLSPIHVGTGDDLQLGIEFAKHSEGEKDYLGIWDLRKLHQAMQDAQFDRMIRILASGESPENYLKEVIPKKNWGTLFSRKMQLVDSLRSTLKPHVHTGMGKVYIPGSAIKGAIMTGIIAKEAEKIPKTLLVGLNRRDLEQVVWKQTVSDNMSYSPGRFLKVGDVDFSAYQTQAWLGSVLNLNYEKLYEWKKGTDQMIECIAYGAEATGRIAFDLNALEITEKHPDKKNHQHKVKLSTYLKDLSKLTQLLNQGQLYWLERELQFIKNYNGQNESEEDALLQYGNDLQGIKNEIENLKSNKAIIRVGAGSGYKSLSGNLLERLEKAGGITSSAHQQMVEGLRGAKYRNTPFPKTRKVFKDGVAWGFLKLTFHES